MQVAQDPDIKRRADGSIDTEFYIKRGRFARACQARDITRTIVGRARGVGNDPTDPSLVRTLFVWRRQAT